VILVHDISMSSAISSVLVPLVVGHPTADLCHSSEGRPSELH